MATAPPPASMGAASGLVWVLSRLTRGMGSTHIDHTGFMDRAGNGVHWALVWRIWASTQVPSMGEQGGFCFVARRGGSLGTGGGGKEGQGAGVDVDRASVLSQDP